MRRLNYQWFSDDGTRKFRQTIEIRDTGLTVVGPPTEKASGREPKPPCEDCGSTLRRLAKGGLNLLKSELGLDAADDATEDRRAIECQACEFCRLGVCQLCGCFVAAKITIKGEACPDRRW